MATPTPNDCRCYPLRTKQWLVPANPYFQQRDRDIVTRCKFEMRLPSELVNLVAAIVYTTEPTR